MKKLLFIAILFFSSVASAGFLQMQEQIIMSQNAGVDYTADANCMGAWYMNGGLSANGDDETDRSGEGGTLTETVGDIPNSADVSATYSGTSRDFEYTESEYLTHADGGSTDITGTALSIVAWIKTETISNTVRYAIVSKNDVTTGYQYMLFLDGTADGKYKIGAWIGATPNTTYSTTTDYAQGTEQFIAVVYNGTDVRIYVDGILASDADAYTTAIADKACAFLIGASLNDSSALYYFDGLIDEVAVFDRELTATEVLDIKNNGISGDKGGSD